MPWITTLLLTVILLLQYTLWLGRGSLPHLEQIEQSLKMQKPARYAVYGNQAKKLC